MDIREHFICDNAVMEKSNKNYEVAELRMNPPSMSTSKGGNYSNDYQSQIVRAFMKLLNEDRQAKRCIFNQYR